jgi:hypothetical protein
MPKKQGQLAIVDWPPRMQNAGGRLEQQSPIAKKGLGLTICMDEALLMIEQESRRRDRLHGQLHGLSGEANVLGQSIELDRLFCVLGEVRQVSLDLRPVLFDARHRWVDRDARVTTAVLEQLDARVAPGDARPPHELIVEFGVTQLVPSDQPVCPKNFLARRTRIGLDIGTD